MQRIALLPLLMVTVIFSGCAALASVGGGSGSGSASAADATASAVAPGPSLFNFVGKSTKFIFVSPSALLADSPQIENSLMREQCMFHSADPPFLVPSFNQKWLFVGRMNQGPTIQALEYKTIFTLGLTGPQQLNAWPVSMVSLSDFPDAYLAERVSFLGNSQPDVRSDVLSEYIGNSRHIKAVSDQLIKNYNPSVQCNRKG
jgi:hypothetical protein